MFMTFDDNFHYKSIVLIRIQHINLYPDPCRSHVAGAATVGAAGSRQPTAGGTEGRLDTGHPTGSASSPDLTLQLLFCIHILRKQCCGAGDVRWPGLF